MAQHRPAPIVTLFLCIPTANTSFQPALVLEMPKILLENYCFPENLVGMEQVIHQAIKSAQILKIADKKTLAAVLTVGVQWALNDPRLTVSYEPSFTPVMPSMLPTLRFEQLKLLVRNSVKVDILENNTGYLWIDQIVGEETEAKLGSLLRDNSCWHILADFWSVVHHSWRNVWTQTLSLLFILCMTGRQTQLQYCGPCHH